MRAGELPPVPSSFTSVMAARDFVIRTDTDEVQLRVEIGEPRQDVMTTTGTDWRCPVRVTIGHDSSTDACMGVDSLQALLVAIRFTRSKLESIAEGTAGTIVFADRDVDPASPEWLSQLF